jgi:hypothetical protein
MTLGVLEISCTRRVAHASEIIEHRAANAFGGYRRQILEMIVVLSDCDVTYVYRGIATRQTRVTHFTIWCSRLSG